jgi:hypothetical protein
VKLHFPLSSGRGGSLINHRIRFTFTFIEDELGVTDVNATVKQINIKEMARTWKRNIQVRILT